MKHVQIFYGSEMVLEVVVRVGGQNLNSTVLFDPDKSRECSLCCPVPKLVNYEAQKN